MHLLHTASRGILLKHDSEYITPLQMMAVLCSQDKCNRSERAMWSRDPRSCPALARSTHWCKTGSGCRTLSGPLAHPPGPRHCLRVLDTNSTCLQLGLSDLPDQTLSSHRVGASSSCSWRHPSPLQSVFCWSGDLFRLQAADCEHLSPTQHSEITRVGSSKTNMVGTFT